MVIWLLWGNFTGSLKIGCGLNGVIHPIPAINIRIWYLSDSITAGYLKHRITADVVLILYTSLFIIIFVYRLWLDDVPHPP